MSLAEASEDAPVFALPDPIVPPQAARIMKPYRRLFPQLKDVEAEYCWHGNLALSADSVPHIGADDGLHYCATGSFSMALYLGNKIASRILGREDAATVLDQIPLPDFPMYKGKPGLLYVLLRWVFGAMDLARIAAPK